MPGARRPSAVCTVKGGAAGSIALKSFREERKKRRKREKERESERAPQWPASLVSMLFYTCQSPQILGKEGNLRVASFCTWGGVFGVICA